MNKIKIKIDENPYFNIKEGFREKGRGWVGGEGGPPLIFGCLLEHVRDSFGIDSLSYILTIVCM